MIRFVSLFCGIGNADAGMYAAADELGIEVECVAAYDSWGKACEIYNRNLPHPVAEVADVKKLTRADLPPHDLVIGGPPCQPFSMSGKRKGPDDPRDCVPDFMRLATGSAWLMENVVSLLINAPWSQRLCAADFGDPTNRRRWFYSNYLLHAIPTPSGRRFGDIRSSIVPKVREHTAKRIIGDDDLLPSLTAHAWHGYDKRAGWLIAPGRCVTLLEMARAHGIPDSFDWRGIKGDPDGGIMRANAWPLGMATAVCRAMLVAMGAVEAAA
jgi:site-specific DNA-cytosine methylase